MEDRREFERDDEDRREERRESEQYGSSRNEEERPARQRPPKDIDSMFSLKVDNVDRDVT